MTEDSIRSVIERATEFDPEAEEELVIYTAEEFLTLEIPPREHLLRPVLPKAGLAMLYAARGVGKTWTALSIACAVSTGGNFLRWKADKAHRVLYVDGEMPARAMQDRLASTVHGMGAKWPSPDYLRIITPDSQRGTMPDIATEQGQARLSRYLDGVDLVIIDNLACLVRSGKSNEEEAWRPVQSWALQLRRRGIAVLFVHHAGKGGDQRGTSAREDILDTVIKLSRPSGYKPDDGAKFLVEIAKGRDVFADDASPFEASLETRENAAVWAIRAPHEAQAAVIKKLAEKGYSQRDIAIKAGVSPSTVNRRLKKARQV